LSSSCQEEYSKPAKKLPIRNFLEEYSKPAKINKLLVHGGGANSDFRELICPCAFA